MSTNIAVELLDRAASQDAGLVEQLTALINDVYDTAESGLWRDGATRTTAPELAQLIAVGQIAVATAPDGHIVGSVHVHRASTNTNEFGLLVAAPDHRDRHRPNPRRFRRAAQHRWWVASHPTRAARPARLAAPKQRVPQVVVRPTRLPTYPDPPDGRRLPTPGVAACHAVRSRSPREATARTEHPLDKPAPLGHQARPLVQTELKALVVLAQHEPTKGRLRR